MTFPYGEWIGHEIVIDTLGEILYIGVLQGGTEDVMVLGPADVHEMSASRSTATKEIYIMEARKYGMKPNRERVFVRMSHVKSFSLLCDVIEF